MKDEKIGVEDGEGMEYEISTVWWYQRPYTVRLSNGLYWKEKNKIV